MKITVNYVKKDKKSSKYIYLGDGGHIRESIKKEWYEIENKIDRRKKTIGVIMHNITSHYSGGRYWGWLLAHILGEHSKYQVVVITDNKPPFGNSFQEYKSNIFFHYTNLRFWIGHINWSIFDYLIGIPKEGGIIANSVGKRYNIPVIAMLFESPNFVREYRGGIDSSEEYWSDYKKALLECDIILNNTELGARYVEEWIGENIREKNKWLWNSINTKVADKVSPDIQKGKWGSGKLIKVVFAGRTVAHKNLVDVVKSIGLIDKYQVELHLVTRESETIKRQIEPYRKKNTEIIYHHNFT